MGAILNHYCYCPNLTPRSRPCSLEEQYFKCGIFWDYDAPQRRVSNSEAPVLASGIPLFLRGSQFLGASELKERPVSKYKILNTTRLQLSYFCNCTIDLTKKWLNLHIWILRVRVLGGIGFHHTFHQLVQQVLKERWPHISALSVAKASLRKFFSSSIRPGFMTKRHILVMNAAQMWLERCHWAITKEDTRFLQLKTWESTNVKNALTKVKSSQMSTGLDVCGRGIWKETEDFRE